MKQKFALRMPRPVNDFAYSAFWVGVSVAHGKDRYMGGVKSEVEE